MTTVELWNAAMYCVGVFVTCNAGGIALRLAAGRLSRRKEPEPERRRFYKVSAATTKELADALSAAMEDMETDGKPFKPQTFEEIRREVDAFGQESATAESAASGEANGDDGRLTPEELAAAYRRGAPAASG